MYDQDNLGDKKPPAFPLFEPQESIPYNWNIDNMPWKTQSSNNVMLFNGIPVADCEDFPSTSNRSLRKRKNEFIPHSPSKQHISEAKMAAFLNSLHISNDYQSHSIKLDDRAFEDDMDYSTYNVNLSAQELEERLKNAQKIVLCEDVKKTLEETNRNEIYKVLADRIEKPCQALILWQPPKPIEKLITNFDSSSNTRINNTTNVRSDKNNQDGDNKNNNEEEEMILE